MIFCVNRLKVATQWVVSLVFAATLALPVGAVAANQTKTPTKVNKPVAAKQVEKKKSVATRVGARKTEAASAKGRTVAAKAVKPGDKRKAQLAKSGRNTPLAKAPGKKQPVARSGPRAQGGNKVTLVAHSRPAAASVMLQPRLSAGERLGLRESEDPLDLNSSVALVVDQETSEVLFSKNDTAVLPIASLTKLMTGLVIADASLPMDELITITEEDAAVYRNSRLAVGTQLTRGELMHLSLMSSENRAAHALGRTFPGGSSQFVRRMNTMALELGMQDTRYVEPTGLSSQNQSSARDLATLVSVSYQRQILRDLSTSPGHQLDLGHRTLQYNNSNRLIRNPEWEIGLQKTGYIAAAGRCLVMQAKVAGRRVIMVFLDSAGKLSRVQDAERVRRWVEAQRYQQYFVLPQG
ncbi:MAG: hypothetical protein C0443_03260 [Comamonadaceae bacterium]|nr:hypothetical protein [Comamonadaceae bacterium]